VVLFLGELLEMLRSFDTANPADNDADSLILHIGFVQIWR
jgi:hypothetical protein